MLNPDFVRFKIQMWNQGLRLAVLDRLRTLPGLNLIQEDDVHVLPFERVQLVCKSGSFTQSIKFMDKPKSYHRLNETFDFFFECDSLSTAYILAEKLRSIPLFLLEKWELALECRGLTLPRNEPSAILQNSPIFKFSLSAEPAIQPSTIRKTDQLNEFRSIITSYSSFFSTGIICNILFCLFFSQIRVPHGLLVELVCISNIWKIILMRTTLIITYFIFSSFAERGYMEERLKGITDTSSILKLILFFLKYLLCLYS